MSMDARFCSNPRRFRTSGLGGLVLRRLPFRWIAAKIGKGFAALPVAALASSVVDVQPGGVDQGEASS